MAKRWNNQREADASDPAGASGDSSLQFGWSPHPASSSGARSSLSVSERERTTERVRISERIPSSNGPASPDWIPVYRTVTGTSTPRKQQRITVMRPVALDEFNGDADPIPVYRTTTFSRFPSETKTAWPGASRSGSHPLYRRVPHALIVMVALAMVLGGGFWNRDQSVLMPGGTDTIQSVSNPFQTNNASLSSSVQGLVASTNDNVLEGYLSASSLSVTPQQLGIDNYITGEGQAIADVASETGRSEETLLWANDYSDATQTLPAGTQLRIPPTDGMLHLVNDGDTLENIAERYGVTTEDITSYAPNGVEHSADLVPNRLIMVPGGTMPMRDEVIFYTVRDGDALWQIADRFGLQSQTILWTNSLSNADSLTTGQQLAILPTDGVMAQVGESDTVESLAQEWGVEPSAIRDWPANGLGADGSLIPGQSVMIPGGSPPEPPEPEPQPQQPAVASEPAQPAQPAQSSQPAAEPAPQPAPEPEPSAGTGRLVWPTTGVITQYFHSAHNGWDIANRLYTDIWAADSGTVTFSGWNNYGLGYAVAIDHGNGYVTWYGHMAEPPPVRTGQWVDQGQYIGPMGSTGYSTGPHVHFVIAYNGVYQNPGNYLR